MEAKIYKCFIASPGDTINERDVCEKVFDDINKSIGKFFNFRIESLRWENDTRPGFGEYSQAVISQQMGNDYDLFIGIMSKKFGSPTKAAGSGTEEEFNNAYQRILKKENLDIMFYFNNEAPKTLSEINIDELQRVNSFKEKIANLGGYYFTYVGLDSFEDLLRRHLNFFFTTKYSIQVNEDNSSKIKEGVTIKLKERFEKSLRAYSTQPIIWVEPLIHRNNLISNNPDENYDNRVLISDLIFDPQSTIIKAPTQFGLTSLSHYLAMKAWEESKLWVYIDSDLTKTQNIHNAVKNEVTQLGLKIEDVNCIILDSWDAREEGALKKLRTLCNTHKEIPIFVMQRIDSSSFFERGQKDNETIEREFVILNLMALPRNQIRKVVSEYNRVKEIGDENKLLTKVISDLDILNIHRTPINCITLLKVSEKHFDESPVNRTNMLEMVLFILFNMDGIPKYRTKPDLKDCEYILGRFCEDLIRNSYYQFSRKSFIEKLSQFCSETLIDLEVDLVFDVLADNNIIIKLETDFSFRNSYWIFYFAAKRMHNSADFADYIFSSKKYNIFPEIIEFYTGIDRNRKDALDILFKDLKSICDTVEEKVALPDSINPFAYIQWVPTEEQLEKVQQEINQNVIDSGLPESIKDQYADNSYDQMRPYDQSVSSIFEEYSLYNLMQSITASSRALRNSDYVESSVKRQLIEQIFRGWGQISNVLLALTPVIAREGSARFEGVSFVFAGDKEISFEEKVQRIILLNPYNVVLNFKDDIFSTKIGPLLFDQLQKEKNLIKKHQIVLLLTLTRPREWRKHIEEYISSIKKDSYYLYDLFLTLHSRYKYDFASTKELTDLSYLIKMTLAKHEFGDKKPGLDKIAKISNKVIPKRDTDND